MASRTPTSSQGTNMPIIVEIRAAEQEVHPCSVITSYNHDGTQTVEVLSCVWCAHRMGVLIPSRLVVSAPSTTHIIMGGVLFPRLFAEPRGVTARPHERRAFAGGTMPDGSAGVLPTGQCDSWHPKVQATSMAKATDEWATKRNIAWCWRQRSGAHYLKRSMSTTKTASKPTTALKT